MTTAQEIVCAAIPGASAELADAILWNRTPFPCGPVSARDLFRAASAWRRAKANGIALCTLCDQVATPGHWDCGRCRAAVAKSLEGSAE